MPFFDMKVYGFLFASRKQTKTRLRQLDECFKTAEKITYDKLSVSSRQILEPQCECIFFVVVVVWISVETLVHRSDELSNTVE